MRAQTNGPDGHKQKNTLECEHASVAVIEISRARAQEGPALFSTVS
ncbi:hypothetical protein [Streptomyces sp. NBC_00154]|nr:hypothetical protein [Streptomyces sp. NBC_00154]MCX5314026.1 hypothetical protein [Streptomyces sp. NBC_00154]